jgi:outer membrane protein assembly factor BamE
MRAWRLLAVLPLLALGGCLSVYKMDVQQGNVISQEMVDQLKPGMTRSQVRFVLGTPLVSDPFHPERWDYIYHFRRGAAPEAESRRLTVIFQNDTLARIVGDVAVKSAPEARPATPAAPEAADNPR